MAMRTNTSRGQPIRIGFLPLNDAAAIVAAESRGLFAQAGVSVRLTREVGWATIREKIRLGELEAAHAPAPMLWSLELGLGSPPCSVLTPFVLSLNGNALTLARSLGKESETSQGIREIARLRKAGRPLTIGTVFPYASHNFLIREWLRRVGLSAERDVRIVVVPPAQMHRNLVAGTIDGYAAGEPWNSLAVAERVGWCPIWSAALGRPQVEKVLLVTRRFAEARPEHLSALVACLATSAAWCDEARNREDLARILAGSRYVNVSNSLIAPPLLGHFDAGLGAVEEVPDFHIFHRGNANLPSAEKALFIQAELQRSGMIPRHVTPELPGRLFRADLYAGALGKRRLMPSH